MYPNDDDSEESKLLHSNNLKRFILNPSITMGDKKASTSQRGKTLVSGNNKTGGNRTSQSANYFTPLQTLADDDDSADDSNPSAGVKENKTAEPKPPPINVIKNNSDQIHKILNDNGVNEYTIKRMSIGIKILPVTIDNYRRICEVLTASKCEYFSHSLKSELPFKVTLTGLDINDYEPLKSHLIAAGIKCMDIKPVSRKTKFGQMALFIVYLERGTITLKELREKCGTINRTIVKWNFHRKLPRKVTQCYNCQMFGHGSKHCRVKTFCAHCSGPHATTECSSKDNIKCANCHGNHKSTDPGCPSRRNYVDFRQKMTPKKPRRTSYPRGYTPRPEDFPSLTKGNYNQHNGGNLDWSSIRFNQQPMVNTSAYSTNNTNLFTPSEIHALTNELITKLKMCKDKYDQFNVITELALKYLKNSP